MLAFIGSVMTRDFVVKLGQTAIAAVTAAGLGKLTEEVIDKYTRRAKAKR